MQSKSVGIVMIGAFPPPIHGMAVVNQTVLDRLRATGTRPVVIDVSALNLSTRFAARLNRLIKTALSIFRLVCMTRLNGANLYMSVSGGLGQLSEIVIVLVSKLKNMELFLHHHSFSYLSKFSAVTQMLINASGPSTLHITLSDGMAKQLKQTYDVLNTLSLSNAFSVLPADTPFKIVPKSLTTLGFISNISAQKGIFNFIELIAEFNSQGLPLNAKIAGPFESFQTQKMVAQRLTKMANVEYVGPTFGPQKENFFKDIDVMVFPTQYKNEADPLIVIEAMRYGVPVIAYGRGCISETIGLGGGKVIDPNDPFIPAAMKQIKQWIARPATFETAKLEAFNRFSKICEQANVQWLNLLHRMASNV